MTRYAQVVCMFMRVCVRVCARTRDVEPKEEKVEEVVSRM